MKALLHFVAGTAALVFTAAVFVAGLWAVLAAFSTLMIARLP
jgi:hypothetical protein